jgi:small subunit ribosomal protein S8
MSLNDPISDYLTRIRNAVKARHSKVDIPASKIIKEITKILLNEGYIRNFTVIDNEKQGIVRVYLKYNEGQKSAITGLRRVSRPGYRQYTKVHEIPRVLNGLGIAILSTPRGLVTDRRARKERLGGEILCHVW